MKLDTFFEIFGAFLVVVGITLMASEPLLTGFSGTLILIGLVVSFISIFFGKKKL